MYYQRLETSLKNKQAHDAALKINAKERRAGEAAYRKRTKGGRAIIPA